MKKNLMLVLASIFAFVGYGQKVSTFEAKQVAGNFLYEKTGQKSQPEDFSQIYSYTQDGDVYMYIIPNKSKQGFVIVPADKTALPVLGYSLDGKYSENGHSPAFEYWMKNYAEEIQFAKEAKKRSPETAKLWDKYNCPISEFTPSPQKRTVVGPLFGTDGDANAIAYNQSPYYNADCPGGSVTGCVATAISQIMVYHDHPNTGIGYREYVHSTANGYQNDYGTLTADFGNTTYNIAALPPSISAGNADVAQLCHHAGVSVLMNYDPSGSSSSSRDAAHALITNWNYDINLEYKDKSNYTTAGEWENMIRTDLDNSLPVIYRGTDNAGQGGHAWICDGYDDSNNTFHMNWGWGGSDNGWFTLSSLNAGTYNFVNDQGAIFGITPNSSSLLNVVWEDFDEDGDGYLSPDWNADADGDGTNFATYSEGFGGSSNSFGVNYNNQWAVSPKIGFPANCIVTVSFQTKRLNSRNQTIELLYSTGGNNIGSDFTSAGVTTLTDDWAEQTYDLSTISGQNGYIAIKHDGDDDQYTYSFVDNLKITACPAPTEQVTGITFGTVTGSTIDFSGYTAPTNGAAGYAVYVNSANSFTAPSNGDEPTADLSWNNSGQQCIYFGSSVNPNVTVSGLSSNTTYYFKVYAYNDCSGSENYETTGTGASKSTATAPTVTTQAVSAINTTTATGNGNITNLGATNPTAHGVVWNTSGNPTISGSNTDEGGTSATGAFTSNMTGLNVNTKYYVKAYATNSSGTGYGNEVNFFTLANAPGTPTVNNPTTSTLDVAIDVNSNPSNTEFAIHETGTGKYVQANGSLGASAVWQTNTSWGTITVTGLSEGTEYTFEVKARNGDNVETAYGASASGTTTSTSAPTVTTQAVSDISTSGATGNGTITDLGNPNPTQHGIVWNTTGTPTTSDNKTENGAASATGAFTGSMTSLDVNTQYYVRAYATNSVSTSYGSEVDFYTLANVPNAPTVNNATTSTLDVIISVNSNPAGTEFAIYETTTAKYVQADGSLNTSAVWQTNATWATVTVTGLSEGTEYTFKVKARNGDNVETAFGTTTSGTTNISNAPNVTTQAVTAISTTGATGNGNITALGSSNPTAHGVAWNTSGNPNTSGSHTDEGGASTTGAFTSTITGLDVNTQYYVRAYATNSVGTSYGSQVSFYTLANIPAAPTVDNPTFTTLDVTINVNSNPTNTTFAIQETGSGNYIQADGSIGGTAVWQSNATWGTVTVTGLTQGTEYTYKVKARNGDNVETALSSGTSATTNSTSAPTVTTQDVTAIATTSATGNGNITDLGTPNPTQHGIVWNTAGAPTTANNKTENGSVSATGAFTGNLSGLTVNTRYYVKAYATNLAGTAYGTQVDFYTLANVPGTPTVDNPTVSTLDVTIDVNANPTNTEYAIYETSTSKFVQADGSLAGTEIWQTNLTWGTITVNGLDYSTEYTFKIKARNGDNTETLFGTTASATTSDPIAPIILTQPVSGITTNSATGNGKIIGLGSPNPTQHGIVWNEIGSPSVSDNKTENGAATNLGDFTGNITGLSVNKQYFTRAFAINAAGTYYGTDESFYSLANVPNAPTVNNPTATSLDITINPNSNPANTEFAIYETGTGKYVQADGSLSTNAVWQTLANWGTLTVSGLTQGTSYTFKVKARNGDNVETALSSGTTMSTEVTDAPVVTTQDVSNITTNSAIANGTITKLGISNPTAHGVVYNTTGTPTTADSKTDEGNAASTGIFTSNISGLNANTRYYVKAYATNTEGTAYGQEVNFYTLANVPDAPLVNNATPVSLDVTINANANPATTEFAIFETTTGKYLHADGTLNASAVWQTSAVWGTVTVINLSPLTSYTFKVKARSGASVETALSAASTLSTAAPIPPVVTTQAVTDITKNSATGNGNITNLGSPHPTQHGIVWSTNSNPTVSDSKTESGNVAAIGTFTGNLSALSYNTKYYVNAYATNDAGTVYGTQVEFWTEANTPGAPVLSNAKVSALDLSVNTGPNPVNTEFAIFETSTGKYLDANGNLLSDTEIWQTSGTWGTMTITGLNENTTYTFKVKARNGANVETVFGAETSLMTTMPNAKLWQGITNDWNDPQNWHDGQIPGQISNVTILANPPGGHQPVVVGHLSVNTLTIEAGIELVVTPDGGLLILNDLINAGTITVKADTENKKSGYIVARGTITNTGNMIFERYLSAPLSFHFVSSPFTNETTGIFDKSDDVSRLVTKTQYGITAQYYESYENSAMQAAHAYSVYNHLYGYTAQFVAEAGESFNSGIYNITCNNAQSLTPSVIFIGQTLVGNPYPATIDFGLLNHNGMFNSFYIRNGRYNVYWNETNGVGIGIGNIPAPTNGLIAPTQGFVMLTDELSGINSVQFTENAIVTDINKSYYKDKRFVDNILRLKIANQNEAYNAETVVLLRDDATFGFDKQHDINAIIESTGDISYLYTKTPDEQQMVLNAIPIPEEEISIPLAFTSVNYGNYTISATELELSAQVDIMLEDLLTGTNTNISENSYEFKHTSENEADRFIIHFKPKQANNISSLEKQYQIYAHAQSVYIKTNDINKNETVCIYNILGEKIIEREIIGSLTKIDLNVVSGTYFVRIINENNQYTEKVYIAE